LRRLDVGEVVAVQVRHHRVRDRGDLLLVGLVVDDLDQIGSA
jgi:hypothetical protein